MGRSETWTARPVLPVLEAVGKGGEAMGPSPRGNSPPHPLPPLGEAELRETLNQALSGDQEARQRLIQSHLRLVWDIVRRFRASGENPEDLFQLGCLGLVKALDRFDPSYGTRFSTYAVPLIIGEIRRHLRDDGPVHVPRRAKEMVRRAWGAREELTKATGREPTAAEIAAAMGVEVTAVVEALEAVRRPVSLYRTSGEDGAPYLLDQLAACGRPVSAALDGATSAAGEEDEVWDRVALREALSRLDQRTRRLVLLRFFEDRTQADVGRLLGLSQVQISRLEKEALRRLQGMLSTD